MSFHEIAIFSAPLHPDTVEFSKDKSKLVCGCYEYDEKNCTTSGVLMLFSIDNKSINLIDTQKTFGVLDISWIDENTCIAALSNGFLCSFTTSNLGISLDTHASYVSSSLLLSVDSFENKAITSDSSGMVHLFDINSSSILTNWKAHKFEPWSVSINRIDPNLVMSGGDDCSACLWDLREGPKHPILSLQHEMGVCSVTFVPHDDHFVSTGSFDEHLRIFDRRSGNKQNAVVTCKTDGGGVWRHKWTQNAAQPRSLLACMHAGFAISSSFSSEKIADQYKKLTVSFYRQSAKLAYGVDWIVDESELFENKSTIPVFSAIVATCSFYDNLLTFATYTE